MEMINDVEREDECEFPGRAKVVVGAGVVIEGSEVLGRIRVWIGVGGEIVVGRVEGRGVCLFRSTSFILNGKPNIHRQIGLK